MARGGLVASRRLSRMLLRRVVPRLGCCPKYKIALHLLLVLHPHVWYRGSQLIAVYGSVVLVVSVLAAAPRWGAPCGSRYLPCFCAALWGQYGP